MDDQSLPSIGVQAMAFKATFQSLQLATVSGNGVPEASYAAFVEKDHQYYIYVSELAPHCANLRETSQCAIMWIESEQAAVHLFARKRLTFKCDAIMVSRDTPEFKVAMALFYDKFGRFMDMISAMTDFHMVALKPKHGSYVAGFAKAYHLSGDDMSQIVYRNEQGHTSSDQVGMQASAASAVHP